MTVPLYQAKADLLRVLGHPARIRVLELLAEREYAAGELLAEIPIDAGSLSQQLAVLRRAGLVEQSRKGGSVVYTMIVPEVRSVLHAARSLLAALPGEAEALAGPRMPVIPAAVRAVASAVARRPLAG